jgi:hypothetical protein
MQTTCFCLFVTFGHVLQALTGWVAFQFERNQKKPISAEIDISEGNVLPDLVELLLGRKVSLSANESSNLRERRIYAINACLDQLRKEAATVFKTDISATGMLIVYH